MERKDRENKSHLRTLGQVLSRAGFQVKSHLDHHGDPYLYIEKPTDHNPIIETLEFGGIRLYCRGKDIISFRPQNRENVEPFGTAYLLDIKGMYKDLIKDSNNEKIGKDLIRYIVEEVLNFFLHAAKSQKADNEETDDEDQFGKIVTNNVAGGTDYVNQVSGDLRRNNTN